MAVSLTGAASPLQQNLNDVSKGDLPSGDRKVAAVVPAILGAAALAPQAPEDRSKNPLYKSLPSLKTTTEALLALKAPPKGFSSVPFRESLAVNWIPTAPSFFEDEGVQSAEREFNAFCQRVEVRKELPSPFSIPPIVHIIWMGSAPPPVVGVVMQSWKKHNPDFEVRLWTDNDVGSFSWSSERSKRLFESAENPAEKSDIWRFEILLQFGGIYSDTDLVCMNSFHDLLINGLTFFAGFESNQIKRFGRPLIGSSVVGAAKDSAVIKRCIDFSQSREEAPDIHQHIRSGPGPISRASYEAFENRPEGILLLPCTYLYPLPWEKRLSTTTEVVENIRPETLAVHLWEGTWFDAYRPPTTATT